MRESCFYSNTYNTTHYYCVYTGISVVRMYISNLSLKTQLRAVGLMSGFFSVNAVHCFSQQRELTLGALLCSPCPDALCCRAVCVWVAMSILLLCSQPTQMLPLSHLLHLYYAVVTVNLDFALFCLKVSQQGIAWKMKVVCCSWHIQSPLQHEGKNSSGCSRANTG